MSNLAICTPSHSSLATYEPVVGPTTAVATPTTTNTCDARTAFTTLAPYNANLQNPFAARTTQAFSAGTSLAPALGLAVAGYIAGGPLGLLIGGAVGLMGCAATVSDSDGVGSQSPDSNVAADAAVEATSNDAVVINPPPQVISADVPFNFTEAGVILHDASADATPDASDAATPTDTNPATDAATAEAAVDAASDGATDAHACPIVSLDPLSGVDVVPNAAAAVEGAPCLANALGVLVTDPNDRPVVYNFVRYPGSCVRNAEGNPTLPPSTTATEITPASVTALPTIPGLNRQIIACDIPPSAAIYCYCAIPTPMPPACIDVITPVCAEGQL